MAHALYCNTVAGGLSTGRRLHRSPWMTLVDLSALQGMQNGRWTMSWSAAVPVLVPHDRKRPHQTMNSPAVTSWPLAITVVAQVAAAHRRVVRTCMDFTIRSGTAAVGHNGLVRRGHQEEPRDEANIPRFCSMPGNTGTMSTKRPTPCHGSTTRCHRVPRVTSKSSRHDAVSVAPPTSARAFQVADERIVGA